MITKSEESVGYLFVMDKKGGPGSGIKGHRTPKDHRDISDIAKQTGVTTEEAENILDTINEYSTMGFIQIRNGENKKGVETIEKFIKLSPKHKGEIYRGLSVEKNFLENASVGQTMDMKGISSWSGDLETAKVFTNVGYKLEASRDRVILVLPKSNSAVSIAQFADRTSEKEMVLSSQAQLLIKSIKKQTVQAYGQQPYQVAFIELSEGKQKNLKQQHVGYILLKKVKDQFLTIQDKWRMDSFIIGVGQED